MTERAERIGYLDTAKGVAIVLVAFFHVTRGFESANLYARSPFTMVADAVAYGFHVQIFFLISGYLATTLIGNGVKLRQRMVSLYYAYIIWSLITFAIVSASGSANFMLDLRDLALLPIKPIQHYWFLLALMVGTLFLVLCKRPLMLVLAGVAASIIAILKWDWALASTFFPYFAIGYGMAAFGRIPRLVPGIAVVAAIILLTAAMLAVWTGIDIRSPVFIPASLAGCYALCTFSATIAPSAVGKLFAFLGARSLGIFLTHVIFGSGFRIVAYKLAPDLNPVMAVPLCFSVSIMGSLVLLEAASRLGLSKILGFMPFSRSLPRPIAQVSIT